MPKEPQLPSEIQRKVSVIVGEVTRDEIDVYARIQSIEDHSYKLRAIVDAWSTQQNEERELRASYARKLLVCVFVQVILVNLAFFLIGFNVLKVDQWTSTSFILAVFTELIGMIYVVLKYLFPETANQILQLLERL